MIIKDVLRCRIEQLLREEKETDPGAAHVAANADGEMFLPNCAVDYNYSPSAGDRQIVSVHQCLGTARRMNRLSIPGAPAGPKS